MSENHRDLVQRFVDMINSHDVSTMAEHTAADHIDHNPIVADGIEANTAFFQQIFDAFPDVKVVAHDLIVDGDRVAGRFEYSGTHQGPFFGIPATGRTLSFQSIDIWRVENGLLAEHWDQLDVAGMFHQLGADFYALQGQ
ncbi:ester cyclase [Streptomyces sp. G-G2]|uniref:ester cyclase n=1 Tax=Streptomyces sp. G-G2 TaxID=3046201 RepID=UPI0024B93BC4|nr:ester cyclase [Streptomyces sp. G-G2]MDJ0384746.1 ester cyclase [Streptomyces sp. G-G2]